MSATGQTTGIQFPALDGRRSTQLTGRSVFAAAARPLDDELAARIERAPDWRRSYIGHLADLVAAGVADPRGLLEAAASGLAAVHDSFEFVRDGKSLGVLEAFESPCDPCFETVEVHGAGSAPRTLEIPYAGRTLRDEELVARLRAWERAGVLEPSAAAAIEAVAAAPQWLSLPGRRVVVLGAAAEMGPLPWLSRWGADVVAVDLALPALWERVLAAARAGAGRVALPALPGTRDPAGRAGADLCTQGPELCAWLAGLEGPLVVGNYAYADGADFVRVAVAADALIRRLAGLRDDVSLAYLATPTDVFAVRAEVVDAARAGGSRVGRALGRLTRGALFAPSYRQELRSPDGRRWGLFDCLVPQQGANYALAKNLQRWRAMVAKREGLTSSANVAPATRTRSVLKNRILAAAYDGAAPFGVEIFEPDTSSALMAALLVHDLSVESSSARRPLDHPYDLFAEGAVHGGLWRLAYQPRSVLPLGVLAGLVPPRRR